MRTVTPANEENLVTIPALIFMSTCLIIAPAGACRAEIAGGYPLHIAAEYPARASESWVTYAASIVSSEARDVPSADLAIACTIYRDVQRGYHPWRLYGNPGRWHGYGTPDADDYAAVRTALGGGCEDVPNFRYFGNFNDMHYFRRQGWLGEQPLSLYVGAGGACVVGIP